MSTTIKQRISALREYLKAKGLHAFIIPSSDSHLSEYPADHWKSRQWISGFTGSAGTVVVTHDKAGLWTDSRYFLQAEKELVDSGIELFREKLPDTPGISTWLSGQLSPGQVVGVDGNVFSAKEASTLLQTLSANGLHLNTDFDPFAEIRTDRPDIPLDPVYQLPTEITGASASEKISRILTELDKIGADGLLVSTLDTIAWIFNLRGSDVTYNPVFASYAYLSAKETVLFIHPEKISREIALNLQSQGVTPAHYTKIMDYIGSLRDQKICVQSDKVSISLYRQILNHNEVIDSLSPADLLKSIKNPVEIDGFRSAMIKDGVALVRFFRWLEATIPGGDVTELTIAQQLVHFRGQQDRYVGESFGTIAGYGENGAIVHYNADETTAKTLHNEGLLLIDSGAQYFDGTTDITRTIAVGPLSDEMKRDFTLVLKGHIALASAVFPLGTRGAQLDVLTRQFIWKSGTNYLHGTGHGIGHFLNVHEGPQSIRMEENPVNLASGMILSNEPGIYRTGKYGIRTENLMLVTEAFKSEFGTFLQFDTITLCPIDTTALAMEMLTEDEKKWINDYHSRVYEQLSPRLNEEETAWLKAKTQKI